MLLSKRRTLVRFWVVDLEVTNPFDERFVPPLLEHAHQTRRQGLFGRARHFVCFLVFQHERSSYTLELQVGGDFGLQQNFDQIAYNHKFKCESPRMRILVLVASNGHTAGHDKLRAQVNAVVTAATERGRGLWGEDGNYNL